MNAPVISALLTYWFYPNPGGVSYGAPKVIAALLLCTALIVGSFFVSLWRSRLENPLTRKLSRSWPATLRWFGGIGLVLTVSRVEQVQFLAMRFLWVLWILAAAGAIVLHVRLWRLRHYSVLDRPLEQDPREKYLPKKKGT